ncbi:ABC transporter permease [Desulfobacter latus]|uniref:Iron export ABC transporter permease subunit FetB n=1 Tax=Desulfobacter latus TaxID=2292 RepID=A0A850T936_9BACT|nr:iron export ABC transporter permease subunit FetB [Desulfobacter latus]NWH04998.1 iron export ABC transporter permease subunit FetB [Desulfobacter latus]
MPLTIGALDISTAELALASLFIVAAGAISLWGRIGLGKPILMGAVRCVLQLTIMGYVLSFIFGIASPWLVFLIFCVMVAFAVRIVRGNVSEKSIPFVFPSFVTMLLVYTVVTGIVSGLIVGVSPFWHPQYFIPLAGMVAGNSMTALGLSLDRLLSDLKAKRDLVEMQLCLGATPVEASQDIFRDALKAGMIPSVNSLAGVGLVFLPGMMTGQILSGEDPMLAIRYQIVVMFMLLASTALTVSMVLGIVRQRCFGVGGQLLLRPNRSQ